MRVLSLGAGVQSTYVYLTESLDYAIFADTQDEPKAVYAHLAWLIRQGRAPILQASKGRLSDHLRNGVNSTGQRFASIPSFTATDNPQKEGRVRRQCTKEYKTEVVDRILRREILKLKPRCRVKKGTLIEMLFGISSDEARRAGRIIERLKPCWWIKPRFPLIERMLTRFDCERWLEQHVPHPVSRSACVYCPNRSDQEWLDLKRSDKEGWALAVSVDTALREEGVVFNRKMNQPMFLHRSLQPLITIDFAKRIESKRPELPLFTLRNCEGMCGT